MRVNVPRWKAGKGIGKLSSTGTSFSYTFNNNTFKRGKDKDKDKKKKGRENQDDENWDGNIDPRENARKHSHDDDGEEPEMGADGYMKWSVPWSFTFNYSINYSYGSFNKEKLEYNGRITQNLSFSGSIQPTKNWNFGFSASLHELQHLARPPLLRHDSQLHTYRPV